MQYCLGQSVYFHLLLRTFLIKPWVAILGENENKNKCKKKLYVNKSKSSINIFIFWLPSRIVCFLLNE